MFTNKARITGFNILLHGVAGVGKTTLAMHAPKAVLLDVEDGGSELKNILRVDRNKNDLSSTELILTAMREALLSDKIETIVIDSLTAIDSIIIQEVLQENRLKSLSGNYGAGYEPMTKKWSTFLYACKQISNKNKNVILIGHNKQELIFDSTVEHDVIKETLHIHKRSLEKIVSVFTSIYFLRYQKIYSQEKNKAISTGKRELLTRCFDESILCKNKYTNVEDSVIFDDSNKEQLTNFWKGIK